MCPEFLNFCFSPILRSPFTGRSEVRVRTPGAGKDSFLLRKIQLGCFCCTSYTFSSLIFQNYFHIFVSNVKRTITCDGAKKHFHYFSDGFIHWNSWPKKHNNASVSSSFETQKPCKHHYRYRLCWQNTDQRCNSRASKKKVGSKTLVVFLFDRNFRPGNKICLAAKTVLVARSLEFNVSSKILTNSGRKQVIKMLEWNT